jgi:hypothetical protein
MSDAAYAVELTNHEMLLAQDAVAAELARYLMHGVENEDYEALVCLGQKLGMEL